MITDQEREQLLTHWGQRKPEVLAYSGKERYYILILMRDARLNEMKGENYYETIYDRQQKRAYIKKLNMELPL